MLKSLRYGVIMAGDSQCSSGKFSFQYLSNKEFNSLASKDAQSNLEKWGMAGRIHVQMYSFDSMYKPYMAEKLALELFQDPVVLHSLLTPSSGGRSCAVGTKASRVEMETVPCTSLSMTLFDKFEQEGIVRENGCIRKCFEEYVDGVCVPDELRQVLLNEDFEKYDIFSDSERQEFLFKLFTHVCVGGGVCQYEDEITPYSSLTKLLYKDLISVQKSPETQDIHVVSCVYKIKVFEDDLLYYPDEKDHINSFSYLIVDPIKRHVTVLHHKYGGGLF